MKVIVFPNPRMKLREEDFGGIAKTDKGIFLLDVSAYTMLRKTDVDHPEREPINLDEVVRELLDIHALIQIKKEDAEWVRKKQQKNAAT